MGELSRYFLYFVVIALPGINLYKLPHFGYITKYLIVLALIFTISEVIRIIRLKKPLILSKITKMFLLFSFLFVAFGVFSYFWSANRSYTLAGMPVALEVFSISILIILNINTLSKLYWLIKLYLIGMLAPIIGIFINYSTSGNYGGDPTRHTAVGLDPNDFGVMIALSIPMVWYLISHSRNKLTRFLLLCYLPLACTAIFLTASRAALLTLIVALAIIPLSYVKLSMPIKIVSLLVLALATYTIIVFVPQESLDRLTSTSAEIESGDFNQRGTIWQNGVPIFLDHWIIGVGSSAFRASYFNITGDEKVAHNTVLSVASETGIIGLMFFLSIFIVLIKAIQASSRQDRTFLLILFLTWIVGTFSLTWEYMPYTWFVFGLIVVLHQVRDDEIVHHNLGILKSRN